MLFKIMFHTKIDTCQYQKTDDDNLNVFGILCYFVV